jgi:hypothetical protein
MQTISACRRPWPARRSPEAPTSKPEDANTAASGWQCVLSDRRRGVGSRAHGGLLSASRPKRLVSWTRVQLRRAPDCFPRPARLRNRFRWPARGGRVARLALRADLDSPHWLALLVGRLGLWQPGRLRILRCLPRRRNARGGGVGTVWYAKRRARWPSPLSGRLLTRALRQRSRRGLAEHPPTSIVPDRHR